jgi:hypothetical protein
MPELKSKRPQKPRFKPFQKPPQTAPPETGSGHQSTLSPEILIRLEADFNPEGQFGSRVLEVTNEEVRVVEWDDVASFRIPIDEIKSARNEPLIGGGRLEITVQSGEVLPVLTYSLHVAEKFSEAARGIEQLAKKEPFAISIKSEVVRCPKCNRLLPEKDGICPACINRGKTLLRIGAFLKPYRAQAFTLAGLSMFSTIINLAPPFIQGTLIDQVLTPRRNINLLFMLMASWLVILAVNIVLQVLSGRLTAYLASHIAADIRADLFRAIEWLQMGYFEKKQVHSGTDSSGGGGFGLFVEAHFATVASLRSKVGALPHAPQRIADRYQSRQSLRAGRLRIWQVQFAQQRTARRRYARRCAVAQRFRRDVVLHQSGRAHQLDGWRLLRVSRRDELGRFLESQRLHRSLVRPDAVVCGHQ